MPLVSVIIPTFNRTALLPRALTSVATQTLRDFDVWVINDGGEEPTLPPSARIISKPNGGPGSARNAGIAASDSRYVAYLDDDDEWRPDHLESLVGLLNDGHEMVYATADVVVSGSHVRFWGDCRFDKFVAEGFYTIFPPSTCLHKRDLLGRCGDFDESPLLVGPEDCEFLVRASDFAVPVPSRRRTVVMHRDDSMTRGPRPKWVDTLDYVIEKNGYGVTRRNWLMFYRAYLAAVREERPDKVSAWGEEVDRSLPAGSTRVGTVIVGDVRLGPEDIKQFCRRALEVA